MNLSIILPETAANEILQTKVLPYTVVDQTGPFIQPGLSLAYSLRLSVTSGAIDFRPARIPGGVVRLRGLRLAGRARVDRITVDVRALAGGHIPSWVQLPILNLPLNPPAEVPIALQVDLAGRLDRQAILINGQTPGWEVSASFDVPATAVDVTPMRDVVRAAARNGVSDFLRHLRNPMGGPLLPDAAITAIADAAGNLVVGAWAAFGGVLNQALTGAVQLIGLFRPTVGIGFLQLPRAFTAWPAQNGQPAGNVILTDLGFRTTESELTINITAQ